MKFIYFGSRQYARVVVFSKAPLPNYRPDLDDKRPLREVLFFIRDFLYVIWIYVFLIMKSALPQKEIKNELLAE